MLELLLNLLYMLTVDVAERVFKTFGEWSTGNVIYCHLDIFVVLQIEMWAHMAIPPKKVPCKTDAEQLEKDNQYVKTYNRKKVLDAFALKIPVLSVFVRFP